MVSTFKIGFIGHNEYQLMEEVIPNNIRVLTEGTRESFDIVLVLDGVEDEVPHSFASAMYRCGIDEIRMRKRHRNVAGGDPSNNAHYHLFSDETPYFISAECDIAIFRRDKGDVLRQIRSLFEENPTLPLLFKIDDYTCWAEPLVWLDQNLGAGLRSASRLASHFLAYNTDLFRGKFGRIDGDVFHDSKESWFNYEDFLSKSLRYPDGPGLGYMTDLPLVVCHCDQKIAPGSPFYKGGEEFKLSEFRRLQDLYKQAA